MKTAADIAEMYHTRQSRLAPRHARLRRISAVYSGDIDLALPEIPGVTQAAVPNLVQQGTDQFARRIASVLPNLACPPLRPGIKASEEKADKRRMVTHGWWERSRIPKHNRQRAAWYVSYSTAPTIVRPDPSSGMPRWELHSPFDVFPSRLRLGEITPHDVIVRHRHTLHWLRDHYPEAAARVHKRKGCGPDDTFDVLEYIGPEHIMFVVLGHDRENEYDPQPAAESMAVEMVTRPNRAGVCWATVAERPGLDAPIGHFDGIIGMYETQAILMALEIPAVRKSIWPEVWLENPNNSAQPRVIQHPDRRDGTPGVITNGRIMTPQMDPSFRSVNTMDRLEYGQRQTAGLPAEFGGMSSSNVRTGRRGAQVLAAGIDFTIAEAQDAIAEAMHAEDERAIAIDKGYFNRSKTIFVSGKGMRGKVDYKPSDVFEDGANHVVAYSMAGTDLSDLVINGGQRVGMGTMSKQSFMEIDPLVEDVDVEQQRVSFEAVQAAFMASVQTLASNPEGPWQAPDIARLAKLMFAEQKVFYEAVAVLQAEKQAEQAQGAPEGMPETMPGLAMPGQGAEVPVVGEQGPSLQNMTSLLSSLGVADQAMKSR